MLILGMGVSSIVTAMGFRPFALAHICLGLLPLVLMWMWSGLFGPAGSMGLLIAAIGSAYMVMLYFISRRIFRLFRQSFDMREQLEVALASAEAAGAAKLDWLLSASPLMARTRQRNRFVAVSRAPATRGSWTHT